MATVYKYFYGGRQTMLADSLSAQNPTLLHFTKIENGVRGEVLPHSHAFLELFYFYAGSGKLEINGATLPLGADVLLVVDAKVRHLQYSDDPAHPLSYYGFAIEDLRMRGLAPNSLTRQGFLLHSFDGPDNEIARNIERLVEEFDAKRYSYTCKTQAIFLEILVDAARFVPDIGTASVPADGREHSELETAKKYLDEHYCSEIDLDLLARTTYLNKSYLVTQFKKLYNISPMRYLLLVRMEHAKRLLSETDSTVTQIASEVGYNNPVYFAEVFSRTFGMSPTAFRKSLSVG